MRYLVLIFAVFSCPQVAIAEEMGDVDIEMIVALAHGLWQGDIMSISVLPEHNREAGKSS